MNGGSHKIDESLIEESFYRSSGPGGQNVNKVSTGVRLRVSPYGMALPAYVIENLKSIAGHLLVDSGELVISCGEHRTQWANRAAARRRLQKIIMQAHQRVRKRRPTRPTRASVKRRGEAKKQRSETKKLRGPVDGE